MTLDPAGLAYLGFRDIPLTGSNLSLMLLARDEEGGERNDRDKDNVKRDSRAHGHFAKCDGVSSNSTSHCTVGAPLAPTVTWNSTGFHNSCAMRTVYVPGGTPSIT
jgi:hypothetical protein